MTVYVIQEPAGKNIISAQEYGTIKIILPASSQVVFNSIPTMRKIYRALENFNDDDYLLLLGDPVAIGIAAAIASRNNFGRVNMLKWDKQEFRYIPVTVDINGDEEGYHEHLK